jgi:mRNA interferase MazF
MTRGEIWWVELDPSVGGEVHVKTGGERRKAMADQISTVSKQRLKQHIGVISREDLRAIERDIRVQLGFAE